MKYTIQGAFDKMCNHLMKQGKKSSKRNENGQTFCMYRGPNNTRCAVGALVPDRLYNKEMEDMTASTMFQQRLMGEPEYSRFKENVEGGKNGFDLLDDVQDVHDAHRPSRWSQRLRSVARAYNLKPPASIQL